ncbi:neural proliferation differentiation and control protein 1 [Varanus komodoensis]|uniref:Neural proliferation, differentiation and control 1 n=1 Tax=Varanus komodoensis TaxID=61221 RepID=A0A8D2KS37_VARKO|nr:neural proliferation differentiation and control protein 1 [Varanus komodoensis]
MLFGFCKGEATLICSPTHLSPPPPESCPRSLDCTLQRRQFCPPGSHACGPCLPQFVDDGHGRCIARTHASGGRATVPGVDGEIDLVAEALAKQEGSQPRSRQHESSAPPAKQPKDGVWKATSLQRGRADHPAATRQPPTEPVQSSPVESPRLSSNDALLLGLIVVCTAAGIAALVVAAVCWCRLQKEIRLAQKTDYPAHMASAPPSYDKISPGDKKLAQTAQMYHYQHQKQQMLSMEKNKDEPKVPEPVSSDEENEEGDFTVYECPGLAPTGEMEVKNPLFDDSPLHPAAPNLRP